jgi:hypothetical protein
MARRHRDQQVVDAQLVLLEQVELVDQVQVEARNVPLGMVQTHETEKGLLGLAQGQEMAGGGAEVCGHGVGSLNRLPEAG